MNSLSANKTSCAYYLSAFWGFAPWRAGHGQIKTECSAGLTDLHVDAATVRMHDVDAHGEPQARTLPHLLGGEEGLEDTRQDFCRGAGAGGGRRRGGGRGRRGGGGAGRRAGPPARRRRRGGERGGEHRARRRRGAG